MSQLKVRYDINRAKKKEGMNRIIIPHCITEKKYDRLEDRERAKAEFDALADDINTHVANKIVTIVGCDTLQATNQIIAEFIEHAKADISHVLTPGPQPPWKTQAKWQEAKDITSKRGEAWYQFNKDVIQKLKGVKEATYQSWDQLDGQPQVIERAYENNTHEFKNIIDKLASKNANRILSSDETLSKNKDLFQLCSAEIIALTKLYLCNESAKIYNWMDKYDTLFYRKEDKEIKSIFNSLRKIAEENNLKVTLRLIDYHTFDEKKRLEVEAKKAQNPVKPMDEVQISYSLHLPFNHLLFKQNSIALPARPPYGPEKEKKEIRVLTEEEQYFLNLYQKIQYQAAKSNLDPKMAHYLLTGFMHGLLQSYSLNSSPNLGSSLLNDNEATDKAANISSNDSKLDTKSDSDNEDNSLLEYSSSMNH